MRLYEVISYGEETKSGSDIFLGGQVVALACYRTNRLMMMMMMMMKVVMVMVIMMVMKTIVAVRMMMIDDRCLLMQLLQLENLSEGQKSLFFTAMAP